MQTGAACTILPALRSNSRRQTASGRPSRSIIYVPVLPSARYVPPSLFAYANRLGLYDALHLYEAIPTGRPALDLELPYLACKSFNAVFVFPRKVVDFLYGIVDLRNAG